MDLIPDEMPVSEARANLSEVVNAVRLQGRMVRLTRRGIPQGAVIPPDMADAIDAAGGPDRACKILRAAPEGPA
jgi:prevent-host-death family protein